MKLILLIISFISFSIINAGENTGKECRDTLKYISLFNTSINPGAACYRIPSLITASNGDLIAAIDERVPSCGDLKYNRNINIVIRRSTDNGVTWLPAEKIIDYPDGESASDPSMVMDKSSGEIFLFFNYMNLDTAKDIYYFRYISSRDNGKSWSAPKDITSSLSLPGWEKDFKFITSGRGIYTSEDIILHTIVNLQKGVFLFGSRDGGKSWSVTDTKLKPADESQITELSDGSWMVNSRVNGAGLRYIHISRDNGKSWQTYPDSLLPDPGCNAALISCSFKTINRGKNILLFSNAGSSSKRENLTVRISYDDGKSWSTGKIIYPGSAAYSSMSVLKDGSIGLFFEKDNYTDNIFVKFNAEWLTDD